MTLENLENLVKIGELNIEPVDCSEFKGLLASSQDRLNDVNKGNLSFASLFDLTYNAAHALSLAALRFHGYRSAKRYLVFQCLGQTVGSSESTTRIFVLCHERRNKAIYEGYLDVDEQLLKELLSATNLLYEKVKGFKF